MSDDDRIYLFLASMTARAFGLVVEAQGRFPVSATVARLEQAHRN